MDLQLNFQILPQPTETTCGASCLHAVYAYYGDDISLEQVIREVTFLEEGGTLAVFLACHALRRGYSARMYTYNLTMFDPTWFPTSGVDIYKRLEAQMAAKDIPKLHTATVGYLEYLERGGEIRLEDLTTTLIRKYLKRSVPILTGLSSTYLYRSIREYGSEGKDDAIRGEPSGHFVVLCGYDKENRMVKVADPYQPNPISGTRIYDVSIDRVVCSILLGVITHDANLLIITPGNPEKGIRRAGTPGR